MRYALLLMIALVACRPATSPRHPAMAKGVEALERITAQTLDQDFGDPQFETAARYFEAVPEDSPDHPTAQALLAQIREGRARHEARQREEAEEAVARAEAEERAEQVSLQRTIALAKEQRAAFEERERESRVAAAQAELARRKRLEVARKEGDRLVAKREGLAAKRRREAEEARLAAQAAAAERAKCEAARKKCRSTCAWVRDPTTGRTGGIGSPISMQCYATCPECDGIGR
ncbi:MAG: hypothetical protein RMA76_26905 [Deltaproteobacteria bacterium]